MKEEVKKPMIEIIILISLSIIILILSIPKAKAITSTTMVQNASITIPQGINYGEYTLNESWGGHPEGTIYFSMSYQLSSGLLSNDNQLTEVRVLTKSYQSFKCQIGSLVSYTDSATQFINYDISCPVDFSSGGLWKILITNRSSDTGQTNVYKIGDFITYVSKSGDNTEVVNAVNDIKNTDINNEDKQQPDQTDYNNYEQNEQQLFDIVEQADTNQINIGMDIPTTTWIWNTMTTLIQSHSLIFEMIISILSIGIIKLALGR